MIFIRNLIATVMLAHSPTAALACPIEDMINSVGAGMTVTLPPGTHDCDHPIILTRDITIKGDNFTVVQAEFHITSGATVHIIGPLLHQVYKPDTPPPGDSSPIMIQDAQIMVRGGASLWLDDLTADADITAHKGFVHAVGSSVYLRAQNAPMVVKYGAVTPAIAIRAYYGSYLMMASFSATNRVTVYTSGIPSGVYIASSQLTMLQATIASTGAANTQCLSLARSSLVSIHGASAFYTCQLGITYQHGARAWVDPAVTYFQVPTKSYHYVLPGEQTLQ